MSELVWSCQLSFAVRTGNGPGKETRTGQNPAQLPLTVTEDFCSHPARVIRMETVSGNRLR